MRWEITGGPVATDEGWAWTLARGTRTTTTSVLRSDRTEADSGRSLIEQHLDDHQPPEVVSLATGWDFDRGRPTEATMGFRRQRGARARWTDVAHRLNLPHWLQPKP